MKNEAPLFEIYELVFTCSILVMIAVILIFIFKIIDLGRIN